MCAWLVLVGLVWAGPQTVVIILVDDLDIATVEGPLEAMPHLEKLRDQGTTFTNAFVTTPVCCPSRASILSGRYQHNTGCLRNDLRGGCGSRAWKEHVEPGGFAAHLHRAGWATGYFGKYLNTYAEDAEGVRHVPPGWQTWVGLRGNSVYYNYTLSANGSAEAHGDRYAEDYLVDLVANRSAAFLAEAFAAGRDVLAMLAPPAAHSPYDPAPQYADALPDVRAPRTPNWNTGRAGKHWLVGDHRVMGQAEVAFSDLSYRRRLLTLRSLDDLIARVVRTLSSAGRLATAHLVFTSDNGFHLGQWTMPDDKRLPYETDLRVPLIVRAPAGTPRRSSAVVLNIDLGPTLLALAGVPVPDEMDGSSYLPLLAGAATGASRSFLVEYHGESSRGYKEMTEPFRTPPYFPGPPYPVKMQDARNNTYACLRTLDNANTIYCEFFADDSATQPYFHEFYDLSADPFQMNNTYSALSATQVRALRAQLAALRRCRGAQCRERVEWV